MKSTSLRTVEQEVNLRASPSRLGQDFSAHASDKTDNRNAILRFIASQRSLIVLVYMVAGHALGVLMVAWHFKAETDPLMPLIFACFVFGIYLLNQVAEAKSDYLNDATRFGVLQKKIGYTALTVAIFVLGLGLAAAKGHLHWALILLTLIGIFYSYPLVPWYAKSTGFEFVRIKDITLLKSLTVAFANTGYIFGFPIIFSSTPVNLTPLSVMLALGLAMSIFQDTVYDDLLDAPGDRRLGVKTLPVVMGETACRNFLIRLSLAWTIAVTGISFYFDFNLNMKLFFAVQALFPMTWIAVHRFLPEKRFLVDSLIETTVPVTIIGLYLATAA